MAEENNDSKYDNIYYNRYIIMYLLTLTKDNDLIIFTVPSEPTSPSRIHRLQMNAPRSVNSVDLVRLFKVFKALFEIVCIYSNFACTTIYTIIDLCGNNFYF